MKTNYHVLALTFATVFVAFISAGAAPPQTNADALKPSTCVPGAKLYYAKDDEGGDFIASLLAQKPREPDAIIERYDAATQTVYFKYRNGKSDSLKLSDPQAERWTVVYDGPSAAESTPVPVRGNPSDWQKSWDGFVALAEQELNKPKAGAPWDGKEVTWEGTLHDMEIMMEKNVIRMVFEMPERTLKIKGQTVIADQIMVFITADYDNFAPVDFAKGSKVRFKTMIAPLDNTHPSVAAVPGAVGETLLLVTTKGGAILK